MKAFAAFTCVFLVIVSQSRAQITITSSDINALFGQSGSFVTDSSGTVEVDVGMAGADQSWDFSDYNITGDMITFTFLPPEGSPFEENFPTSNFMIDEAITTEDGQFKGYSYYELDENAFTFIGYGFEDTLNNFSEWEEDLDVTPLPMAYGNQWSNVEWDTVEIAPGSNLFSLDSSVQTIDAWGTIVTPTGTFDCLRIREDYYGIDNFYFDTLLTFSDTVSQINYQWIGLDFLLLASIESQDGETDPNYSIAQSISLIDNIDTIDEPASLPPKHHDLSQNYPNPFNPVTKITYTVGSVRAYGDTPQVKTHNNASQQVTLTIHNILGQKVATLVSESKLPGTYTATWDASGFPSGVYFYRINIEGNILTRKAMLMR